MPDTPAMIQRELLMRLTAYNLVRALVLQADPRNLRNSAGPGRYSDGETDPRIGKPRTTMNAIFAILLTLVWLASWAGILLGQAGCLTPPETAPAPALVVAER